MANHCTGGPEREHPVMEDVGDANGQQALSEEWSSFEEGPRVISKIKNFLSIGGP